jgi:hypothetical protein
MKAAYLKTTALTTVAVRIPGEDGRTHIVRFEFPIGCTVSVCYEGEAEDVGFKRSGRANMSQKRTDDPVVEWMRRKNVPLRVSNWLTVAYLGDVPRNLKESPELLAEIPWELLENDTDLQFE